MWISSGWWQFFFWLLCLTLPRCYSIFVILCPFISVLSYCMITILYSHKSLLHILYCIIYNILYCSLLYDDNIIVYYFMFLCCVVLYVIIFKCFCVCIVLYYITFVSLLFCCITLHYVSIFYHGITLFLHLLYYTLFIL